jgi:hypothetical protein
MRNETDRNHEIDRETTSFIVNKNSPAVCVSKKELAIKVRAIFLKQIKNQKSYKK